MKTQKRVVLGALFALLFVTNVHGASEGYDYEGGSKLSDKMKFGVGFGVGVGKSSAIFEDLIHTLGVHTDFFGEYKINNRIGVRLSLQPALLSVFEQEGKCIEEQTHWKIAPTLRVYMGKNKKFCLFLGPQVGYLSQAQLRMKKHDNKKERIVDYFSEEDLKAIKLEGYKVNRWAWGLKFGCDYESKKGLIIGGLLNVELPIGNRNTFKKESNSGSSSSSKSLDVLWLGGQQVFYLGYNFAKLLD